MKRPDDKIRLSREDVAAMFAAVAPDKRLTAQRALYGAAFALVRGGEDGGGEEGLGNIAKPVDPSVSHFDPYVICDAIAFYTDARPDDDDIPPAKPMWSVTKKGQWIFFNSQPATKL